MQDVVVDEIPRQTVRIQYFILLLLVDIARVDLRARQRKDQTQVKHDVNEQCQNEEYANRQVNYPGREVAAVHGFDFFSGQHTSSDIGFHLQDDWNLLVHMQQHWHQLGEVDVRDVLNEVSGQ